jgi:hypothetical protein
MARRFTHEDVATVPRGWKVRTVTRGSHRVRIAFPPGPRQTGAGRLIAVLHPRGESQNPCRIRYLMNPAELLIMGANPYRPARPNPHTLGREISRMKDRGASGADVGRMLSRATNPNPHRRGRRGTQRNTGPMWGIYMRRGRGAFRRAQGVQRSPESAAAEVRRLEGLGYAAFARGPVTSLSELPSREFYPPENMPEPIRRVMERNPKGKKKKLATLTPEEDRFWTNTFSDYVNDGYSDSKADKLAWKETVAQFPRLRAYQGATPEATAPIWGPAKGRNPLEMKLPENWRVKPEDRGYVIQARGSSGRWERMTTLPGLPEVFAWLRSRGVEAKQVDLRNPSHNPRLTKAKRIEHLQEMLQLADRRFSEVKDVVVRERIRRHRQSLAQDLTDLRSASSAVRRGNPSDLTGLRYRATSGPSKGKWIEVLGPASYGTDQWEVKVPSGQVFVISGMALASTPGGKIRRRWLKGQKENPAGEAAEEAAGLYQQFHGRAPKEILELQEPEARGVTLTSLGDLIELQVVPLEGRQWVQLDLSGDRVKLAANAKGTQLYFIGGNQTLTGEVLRTFGSDTSKELVELGQAATVVYRAKKSITDFKSTNWEHSFGEESGMRPILAYDARTRRLLLVGGEYKIEAPGIIN